MRKTLIGLIVIFFLLPLSVQAAGVGFVPSTGIWFSRSSFAPGETVRVYSVVINNDYYALDGQVGFYDNSKLIDTVDIKALGKETAKQIKVFWEPAEGEHTVSAQFIKAVAIDEKGTRQELDVSTINGFTGSPLQIGNSRVAPASMPGVGQPGSGGVATSSAELLGATQIIVKKDGEKLVLSAPTVSQPPVESLSKNAIVGAQEVFQKNREILAKAEQVAKTITSTVGKVEDAYNQTKSTIDQGKAYYAKGQEYWGRVSPYVEKARPAWEKVSNNNEPKRVVIIIGVILLLYWIIKWRIKRRLHRYSDR